MKRRTSLAIITTEDEVWPRSFIGAAQAVSWADGFLIHLGDRNLSQLGGEVRARNRRTTSPSVDANGELITNTRLLDLAETISVALSTVRNPAGALYRHVYGINRYTLDTADQLAHLVWDGPGKQRQRTIAKMRALALLVIEGKRRQEGGGRLTKASMIRNINVTRSCYRRSWDPYAAKIAMHVDLWLDNADLALTQALQEKGIL